MIKPLLAAILSCFAISATAAGPSTDLNTWTCTGNCGSSGANGDIGLAPFANRSTQYGFVTTDNDMSDSTFDIAPVILDKNTPNTNGSKFVSPTFTAIAGQPLSVWFNYVTTDGSGYADYSWARLVNTQTSASTYLFTASASNQGRRSVIPGSVVSSSEFDPDVTIVDFKDKTFNQVADGSEPNWSLLGPPSGCWKNGGTCGNTGWVESRTTLSGGTYKLEVGVTNVRDGAYQSGLAFDIGGMTPMIASPVPEPNSLVLFLCGALALVIAGRRKYNT